MKKFLLPLLAAFVLSNAGQAVFAEGSGEILTNAADILALSGEEASRGIAISIKGVVTAAEPTWSGRFFVQDATAGVFVENIGDVRPVPGDVVTVSGISFPGGYAPIISHPHWEKVGTAPLPDPKPVAVEQLMSGAEDGQRIEISGVVRDVQLQNNLLKIALSSGGYRVSVYAPKSASADPQQLVGTLVDVKGTPATAYNAPLRHLISVDVYVPFDSDFIVKKPAVTDPFAKPLTTLNNIARYRSGRTLGDRVHVKGVLTYQRNGKDLFIKDDTGGLQIKSDQLLHLAIGDTVEAVGFPEFENFLPVLSDAVFKKDPQPHATISSATVPTDELFQGFHHAEPITISGKLLDRVEEESTTSAEERDYKTILVLQASNVVFTAESETTEPGLALKAIPIGSIVEVTGICFLQSTVEGKIQSFQVLIPRSNQVRILARPGWLTPQHLLETLAVALLVLIVGTSWTVMVTKRNLALKGLIRERELAQKELQQAHDTLEWRVRERTEQLKFQVTARKEAEVQFKATLAERTRLAKELHDTTEQTMTGVTLQVNTVGKLIHQNPEGASHHLGLVRNMLRMIRVDLRRSIWDLRSRELQQFDLYNALLVSADQIAGSAGIRVEIETKGTVRPLPEFVEETLLRIGQEAVTNTVKHSSANQINIILDFGDHDIALEVRDDGTGFTPENCAGPNEGHFGLLGMAERAKRFGGEISVISAPGTGARIRVTLPAARIETPKVVDEPVNHEEILPD